MGIKYFNFKKREAPSSDPFLIRSGRYKNGKVDTLYRSEWTEDVYVSDPGSREKMGRSFNFSKIGLVVFFAGSLIALVLGKTAWLQIIKKDYYYSMAEGNRIRIERLEPKRGVIYDAKGRAIVRNKANFMLYFVPADLPKDQNELDGIISKVSANTGQKPEDIKSLLEPIKKNSLEAFQPLFIADNIDYEQAMKLYLETDQWPGVVLSNKTSREYANIGKPYLADKRSESYLLSLSHVMGYTGKISDKELETYGDEYLPIDYIGKMGLEFFWENELRGKSGKKQIEVDALGKEKKIISEKEAEAGHNLVLSLDVDAQNKLEEVLLDQLEKQKLKHASAVVMNPRNGEIIAMVSLPAYNNNSFAQGISQQEYSYLVNDPDQPLFNRAISGEFPSGSTIKPVWSAAALEEGVINENTSFISTGGIRIGEWFFPDWKAGGHGVTNVRRAIAESINTFYYYIGGGHEDFRGLGLERLVEYGKLFGLNAQTGVDLAGEAAGFLPSKEWKESTKGEKWYIGDTYHLSIGQGDLLVTPLQVAAYTAVFANSGKLYRPHLVKDILSSSDQLIKSVEAEPVRSGFISSDNIEIVREGMRQGVTSGSSRRLLSVSVPVAGKTGTAQWSEKKKNHAWWTGFAPYDNAEIVVTVLVEEAGEGSDIAVPVVEEFMKWYFGKK